MPELVWGFASARGNLGAGWGICSRLRVAWELRNKRCWNINPEPYEPDEPWRPSVLRIFDIGAPCGCTTSTSTDPCILSIQGALRRRMLAQQHVDTCVSYQALYAPWCEIMDQDSSSCHGSLLGSGARQGLTPTVSMEPGTLRDVKHYPRGPYTCSLLVQCPTKLNMYRDSSTGKRIKDSYATSKVVYTAHANLIRGTRTLRVVSTNNPSTLLSLYGCLSKVRSLWFRNEL